MRNEPVRMQNGSGLSLQVNANGSIRRIDHGGLLLNLFPGNEIEGGPANVYLRRLGASPEAVPLVGPRSPGTVRCGPKEVVTRGIWKGIRFRVRLALADSGPAWFWHVRLQNEDAAPVCVDLLHVQDLALADYGAVRNNEFYTSHYVDHTALAHAERGVVVASRQNLPMGGRNPWSLLGSLGRAVRYGTDGLQFYGLAARDGLPPEGLARGLPGARLQHEHSMVALQDEPLRLEPGEAADRGFFAWYEADHPAATGVSDLRFVDRALALPEAGGREGGPEVAEPGAPAGAPGGQARESAPAASSLFATAALLESLELDEAEVAERFGTERREEERESGSLLSFFAGAGRHVVLKAKERQVLRPHAHILRTGRGLTPDEASMASTVWMAGVFHSLTTQGHVNINRFLSAVHGYLGLFRSHGQRLFAEQGGAWRLLDVPSAFEMAPEACRWVYKTAGGTMEVRSTAGTDRHELGLEVRVLAGPPVRLLVSHHLAVNGDDGSEARPARIRRDAHGVFVAPLPDTDIGRRFPEGGFHVAPLPGTVLERVGGDELLFADGVSRDQPFLCLVTAPVREAGFLLTGRLVPDAPPAARGPGSPAGASAGPPGRPCGDIRVLPAGGGPDDVETARLGEILPWFLHNALIHYLAPHGIEQYSGGGWGTRDICQGAVEMLSALGKFEPMRDLLLRVFKTQNPDGDWPQWFMFFERERNIRPGDSHGDIVFWPLVALAEYLAATGDAAFLREPVPFFHPEGDGRAEHATLWEHAERALAVIDARVIPGTRLAAYGNGDWNDSMQPVNPVLRERLCSAWTVTLHAQTLAALAAALRRLGLGERAAGFEASAAAVRSEFRRALIVDGVVAGYACFGEDGRVEYLLHPRDGTTGGSFRLLPMIHAVINDLLTPDEAAAHLGLIREHLTGVDGARLFDRPMEYRGGTRRHFQRAETAAYFGREIGLMYTHAHLRYAEALARFGDAAGFLSALALAHPIAIRGRVPGAALRQANCYYSSSDAAFADRYEAQERYGRVRTGGVRLEGGWRVYSSGAGIWTRLFVQNFLGVRRQASALGIDPVIPASLDGLRARVEIGGRGVEVSYRIGPAGCGPRRVNLNGADLPFARAANPYRTGAAEVPMDRVREHLRDGANRMTVQMG